MTGNSSASPFPYTKTTLLVYEPPSEPHSYTKTTLLVYERGNGDDMGRDLGQKAP